MKKQSKSGFRMIAVTCATTGEGRSIAEALLKKKLAACVNIIKNVESHFLWKGKIERSSECLLLIKTKDTLVSKVINKIEELHSYECPVIEVLNIDRLNEKASRWFQKPLASG